MPLNMQKVKACMHIRDIDKTPHLLRQYSQYMPTSITKGEAYKVYDDIQKYAD